MPSFLGSVSSLYLENGPGFWISSPKCPADCSKFSDSLCLPTVSRQHSAYSTVNASVVVICVHSRGLGQRMHGLLRKSIRVQWPKMVKTDWTGSCCLWSGLKNKGNDSIMTLTVVLPFSLLQKNWRTESEPGCPGEACRAAVSGETTTAASVGGAS